MGSARAIGQRAEILAMGSLSRAGEKRKRRWRVAMALLGIGAGCTPVSVKEGTVAEGRDISVMSRPAHVNAQFLGSAPSGSGEILLATGGTRVSRGTTVDVAVAGDGILPGAIFGIFGQGFTLGPPTFGSTTDGTPAASFSVTIAPDAVPGLYPLWAMREGDISFLTGSLEVR